MVSRTAHDPSLSGEVSGSMSWRFNERMPQPATKPKTTKNTLCGNFNYSDKRVAIKPIANKVTTNIMASTTANF